MIACDCDALSLENHRKMEVYPYIYIYIYTAGWWFGTSFIFPYLGNNHPN